MDILFGIDLDDPAAPELLENTGALIGKIYCGPLGLLEQLELRLGLRSDDVKTEERIEQYQQRLCQLDTGGSFTARKTIVEPVFGVIKSVMGFQSFSLRGKQKTSGEFSLVCGAYNIKKIVIATRKGEVRPLFMDIFLEKKLFFDVSKELYKLLGLDRQHICYTNRLMGKMSSAAILGQPPS